MIFVDSNLFVIDLRYTSDANYRINRRALDRVAREASGITSVINVLEVCGILSFNLSSHALHALYVHFAQRYRVAIVPGGGYGVRLPAPEARETLPIVAADLPSHQRCVERGSLLVVDALIVEVIEPDRLPSRRLERRYERRLSRCCCPRPPGATWANAWLGTAAIAARAVSS